MEAVALHAAGETFTLGDALEVDIVALGKALDAGGLPLGRAGEIGHAEFFKVADGLGAQFFRQALLGRVGAVFFFMPETEADGLVAVFFFGAGIGHAAGSGLDDRDAVERAVRAEDLRHAQFLADEKFMVLGHFLLRGFGRFGCRGCVFFCHTIRSLTVYRRAAPPSTTGAPRGFKKTENKPLRSI